MLHEQRLIAVSHQLWEDLARRAAGENLSAEGWLQKQLEDTNKEVVERRPDDADEILLDMTLSHFRGLKLSRAELRRVAAALLRTIDTGELVQVGPVGRLARHYRFHRRALAVEVRAGEGAISLPLPYAIRLATLLHGAEQSHLQMEAAA
jgi:hypothetical protein